MGEDEVRGVAGADGVVSVPLAEYGSTDYQKSAPIMQKGYDAANDRSRLLAAFALDDANWHEYLRERAARKRTAAPVPQFIKVQGTSENGATDVARYLKSFQDKPLDPEKLDHALTRLKGVGRYDSAGYRFTEQNGPTGLLVQVVEKNYAPPMFQHAFAGDG